MGTPWLEKLSSNDKKRVIKELVEGQDFAYQLNHLLQNSSDQEQGYSVSAQELAWKIMRSFTESISVLSSCDLSSEITLKQAASNCEDSPCSGDRRSEESSESRKRPGSKDKRGCYKRKKSAETRAVVSSTMEDGHAWRKYGQKEILNSKHPRSYFRCTRKYDQGCKATKQVQRMEGDPQKFQTIYIGNHTCKEIVRAPQMLRDSSDSWESPAPAVLCSSDSKASTGIHHVHLISPVKGEESVEENMDAIMWKDVVGLGIGSDDYGDGVVPGLYSWMESNSQVLELPVDFDSTSDFHFE